MKKVFLILTILIFSFGAVQAQSNETKKEKRRAKIEAMRTAFITEKLDLTEAEAEKFWPINNQYKAKRKAVNQAYKSEKKVSEMSEAEADSYINDYFAKEQQLLDLKKDYIRQLKGVISNKKIIKLQRANRQFKKELLKKSRKRKAKMKGK